VLPVQVEEKASAALEMTGGWCGLRQDRVTASDFCRLLPLLDGA